MVTSNLRVGASRAAQTKAANRTRPIAAEFELTLTRSLGTQERISQWMSEHHDELLRLYRGLSIAVDSSFRVVAITGYESATARLLSESEHLRFVPRSSFGLLKLASRAVRERGEVTGPIVSWLVGEYEPEHHRGWVMRHQGESTFHADARHCALPAEGSATSYDAVKGATAWRQLSVTESPTRSRYCLAMELFALPNGTAVGRLRYLMPCGLSLPLHVRRLPAGCATAPRDVCVRVR
jgi:hypothetical protein